MDFRTVIKTNESPGALRHSDSVLLLGSCFSDNIGARMRSAMMDALVNPTGTLYNPLSVADCVDRLVDDRHVGTRDVFSHNGLWNSFAFHSRYSQVDREAALRRMNDSIDRGHRHLKSCRMVIVTLGSAVTYQLAATGEVVANCHKRPPREFERRLATVDEMTRALAGMVDRIHRFNSEARVVFTVSPIRHIADGLQTNSLSKASLRVAIAQAMRDAPAGVTDYFPAYEILMDDLRDYRFYATDMLHPGEVAIEYVWQTFQGTYLDDRGAQAVARCERVSKRLGHRPFNAGTDQVARFEADTRAVLANLVEAYPHIARLPEIKKQLEL